MWTSWYLSGQWEEQSQEIGHYLFDGKTIFFHVVVSFVGVQQVYWCALDGIVDALECHRL